MALTSCLVFLAVAAMAQNSPLFHKVEKGINRAFGDTQRTILSNQQPKVPLRVLNALAVDVEFIHGAYVLNDRLVSPDNPTGKESVQQTTVHCKGIFVTKKGYVAISNRCVQAVKDSMKRDQADKDLDAWPNDIILKMRTRQTPPAVPGADTPIPVTDMVLEYRLDPFAWKDLVNANKYFGVSFQPKYNWQKEELEEYLGKLFKFVPGERITADAVEYLSTYDHPSRSTSRWDLVDL